MRGTSLTVLLTLAVQECCNAAPIYCNFTPQAGSQSEFSCILDTTADWKDDQKKCRQDYSGTLFAQCSVRSPDGGTKQLICYFANPISPPNLNAGSVINQTGVYAVAIEWISSPSAIDSLVFDYKDGQDALSITCSTQ